MGWECPDGPSTGIGHPPEQTITGGLRPSIRASTASWVGAMSQDCHLVGSWVAGFSASDGKPRVPVGRALSAVDVRSVRQQVSDGRFADRCVRSGRAHVDRQRRTTELERNLEASTARPGEVRRRCGARRGPAQVVWCRARPSRRERHVRRTSPSRGRRSRRSRRGRCCRQRSARRLRLGTWSRGREHSIDSPGRRQRARLASWSAT